MGCPCRTHITAFAALSLLILWAAGPGTAWAGPPEKSRIASDAAVGADKDDAAPAQTSPSEHDKRGLKGVAFSMEDAGDDDGLRLKTAVLVKPLKTDQFFVAFAASAPLINNKGTVPAKVRAALPSRDWNNRLYPPYSNPDRETASDWLVITDWPQSRRLFQMDREQNVNWIPEWRGPAGWHSKMELIFLPADQWTVRAIFSLAHDAPEYRQFLSSGNKPSARIGMAIDVDYQIFNTIALGFDYGHWRYGRTFSTATGVTEISPDESGTDEPVQSDTFTARLTIRF
jgi:hypothetical protein